MEPRLPRLNFLPRNPERGCPCCGEGHAALTNHHADNREGGRILLVVNEGMLCPQCGAEAVA